ncbi:glycosyltransferase family 1 protein [Mucilaginibacter hurinus]|uniref:Glycosyltransferase family 1 protein n=1 Tax=Mucilaginibacter hurinus TaxID=2201324 RepID=A0A367GNU4_9SPHI|nr:glycosyltransferase [Mucilaginibacter hurinus]RCH55129.1 glycosyltransferase family 1 protein [Mucilaginibacter hurinus]
MSDVIKNRDIVIVGQQAWDVEIGSNCKNIALEFSRHNRVLYVNAPLDRITLLKHKSDSKVQKRLAVIKGKDKGLIKLQDNVWNLYPDEMIESINWVRGDWLYNLLNKLNNKRFARSINKALQALEFRNVILFNDNDIFRSFYLKDLLKPAVSIYYSRDYLLFVDYWKKHGEKLEPEIIAKSDLCVANSTYLAAYCSRYNKNSHYVGQGCDLEIFTNKQGLAVPVDMVSIQKPVIGYVGALQNIRLDIPLLAYIARQKPNWSIVLVGPEDDVFKVSELHSIPNIHFLGSKPGEELPAYINAFDVCLNPQLVNQVTIGNYPRKIDEYLAMGKPTVATRTEAMSVFAEHTYLCDTKEDYVAAIQTALNEDSAEKQRERIAFASTHTWENNVKEIYKAINNTPQK